MEKNEGAGWIAAGSQIVSVLFHPLFMPVYGLLVIFFAPTVFYYLSFDAKRLLITVFVTTGILIPAAIYPLLVNRKIITSLTMTSRSDRVVPLIFMTILYSLICYLIYKWQIPVFLKAYSYSLAVIALSLLVINAWWKISLYSAGSGFLTGIIIYLSVRLSTPLIWYISGSIIISGLVMTARLKKAIHNPLQVSAGYFIGLAGIIILMILFQ